MNIFFLAHYCVTCNSSKPKSTISLYFIRFLSAYYAIAAVFYAVFIRETKGKGIHSGTGAPTRQESQKPLIELDENV